MKALEEEARSELTVARVGKWALTLEQMKIWGYPVKVPDEDGGTKRDSLGEMKGCDRCGSEFRVQDPSTRHIEIDGVGDGDNEDEADGSDSHTNNECIYHYGRAIIERIDGSRVQRWSCCGADRTANETGCAISPTHVFKDGKSFRFSGGPSFTDSAGRLQEDEREVRELHSREGFMTARKVRKEEAGKGKEGEVIDVDAEPVGAGAGAGSKKRKRGAEVHEIVAMDCEMIC